MSTFLGKIHFWLFNKIKNTEDLEESIINWALQKDDLSAALPVREIQSEFGLPVGKEPLDKIIDTSNIHGWLQDKIIKAESRQAALITNILRINTEYMNDLEILFNKDGSEKGSEAKVNYDINDAEDIYRVLNDYILEGMPCDNVDKEIEKNENKYVWASTRCLHKQNWQRVGGDIKNYYRLREKWIDSFVRSIDGSYSYNLEYDGDSRINIISK